MNLENVLDLKKFNHFKPLFTLGKSKSFGIHEFFTGIKGLSNVRSKEFSTILAIDRNDFISIIKDNS